MIALIFLEIFIFCLWGWKWWLLAHALGFAALIAIVWISEKIENWSKNKWN